MTDAPMEGLAPPREETDAERRAREAYFTASQGQLIWARFKKQRAAMVAASLLLVGDGQERGRLEELAAGMTLSAYVRACVFAEDTKLRKKRPSDKVEEKKAAAEALALLGQSRIASNLNQLAYHANIGALIVGEDEKAQIAEANAHLATIRALLMEALGKRQKSVQ